MDLIKFPSSFGLLEKFRSTLGPLFLGSGQDFLVCCPDSGLYRRISPFPPPPLCLECANIQGSSFFLGALNLPERYEVGREFCVGWLCVYKNQR